MSSSDTSRRIMRAPVFVIIMTLFWSATAMFEAFIWFLRRDLFYLIATIIAVLLTFGVLRGLWWAYWSNVGVCSIALGVAILQIQVPGWAPHSASEVVLFRAAMTFVMVCIHQFKSFQAWFHIERTKKHRVVFWLLVGFLTSVGQLLLPTIRAWRD